MELWHFVINYDLDSERNIQNALRLTWYQGFEGIYMDSDSAIT